MNLLDARQGDHFPPLLSLLVAIFALVLPCAWFVYLCIVGIARNRRLAARADRPDQAPILRPQRATIVGVVIADKAYPHAMRVEIDLEGSEWRIKNGYRHRWSETARRVTRHRFTVKTDAGKLFEVEPNERALLVDRLDQLHVTNHTERTKSAELSHGERVWISGTFKKVDDPKGEFVDFREPPAPKWVLFADTLSTEPMEDKYRARATFHWRWLFGSLAVSAFIVTLLSGAYWLRFFWGRTIEGEVTGKRTYVTRSSKSSTRHYKLDIRTSEGRFSEEAGTGTYDEAMIGQRVKLLVVDDFPTLAQLGARPTLNSTAGIAGCIFAFVMLGVYRGRQASTRPWYWKPKLIIEGDGKLPST